MDLGTAENQRHHSQRTCTPIWRVVICLTAACFQVGCITQLVARRLVLAPNLQSPPQLSRDADVQKAFALVVARRLRIPVGPPNAIIEADIVEPGFYKLSHTVDVKPDGKGGGNFSYNLNFNARDPKQPMVKPIGTVVLLHGIYLSKESMLHWALYFAESGYRSVLVDLRGHGRSTGKWITYGNVEARDLIQVGDELGRLGFAENGMGVVGISYGAVMGIHWAAQDPRVIALVTVQPYSDVKSAILGVARGNFGGMTKGISDQTFRRAIELAPSKAGFSWSDVDVLADARRLKIALLIFHGKDDNWVLPSQSEAIAAVAPPGSQLHILPGENHVTLSARLDPIAAPAVEWIGQAFKSQSRGQ